MSGLLGSGSKIALIPNHHVKNGRQVSFVRCMIASGHFRHSQHGQSERNGQIRQQTQKTGQAHSKQVLMEKVLTSKKSKTLTNGTFATLSLRLFLNLFYVLKQYFCRFQETSFTTSNMKILRKWSSTSNCKESWFLEEDKFIKVSIFQFQNKNTIITFEISQDRNKRANPRC